MFEAKFIGAVPAEEISGAAVAEKGIADAKVRACVCVCVFVYVCVFICVSGQRRDGLLLGRLSKLLGTQTF